MSREEGYRRDGKISATIIRYEPVKGWALALDDHGVTYFCYINNFEVMGSFDFGDLRIGSVVRLQPVTGHPKGPRGIEIQIVEI